MEPRLIKLGADTFTISIALPAWAKHGVDVEGKETEDEAAPRWNMLFPLGKVKYRSDFADGITFGAPTLQRFEANFRKAQTRYLGAELGFGLPITLTHVGGRDLPPEHKRAVGWIEKLELRPAGLWGLVRWTAEARQRIKADEFRYLSPEFHLNWMDPDTGLSQGPTLFGAALLTDPFLDEMPRVVASTKGAARMDRTRLLSLLGLSAEASDEELEKTLAERMAFWGAHCKDEEAMDKHEKDVIRMSAELDLEKAARAKEVSEKTELTKRLEAQAVELKANIEKLEKLELAARTESAKLAVSALVKSGKLLPAKHDKYLEFALKHGVKELEEMFADAPVRVDLTEKGVDTGTPADKNAARKAFFAEVDKLTKADKSLGVLGAEKMARLAHPELAKQVYES